MLPDQIAVDGETLTDIALAGAEHARTSLETLLGDSMSIVSAHAWTQPSTDAPRTVLADADAALARVGHLGLDGPPNGAAWVAVADSYVQRVLLNCGTDGDADASMAGSIAAEVANIVTGAYVIELSNRWGIDLDATPVRLDAPLEDHEHTLALGCEFADSKGSHGLSVVVTLDVPTGGTH